MAREGEMLNDITSVCPLVESCSPPGDNAGDQMASCNAKGCFFAVTEICDYLCRVTEEARGENVREVQTSGEGTGWSSAMVMDLLNQVSKPLPPPGKDSNEENATNTVDTDSEMSTTEAVSITSEAEENRGVDEKTQTTPSEPSKSDDKKAAVLKKIKTTKIKQKVSVGALRKVQQLQQTTRLQTNEQKKRMSSAVRKKGITAGEKARVVPRKKNSGAAAKRAVRKALRN